MGAYQSQQPQKMKLSYFNIEGKGAPIRMLVRYTGFQHFEDYRFAEGEFPSLKASGAFAFGQVPALEVLTADGEVVNLFQTNSILRYIGKTCPGETYPSDPIKAALVDSLLDQEFDLFAGLTCSKYKERFGYGCLDEATVAAVRKSLNDEILPRHLGFFESLLQKSTTGWLADTPGPSIADFLLAPRLEWLVSGANDGIEKNLLDAFPLLKKFVEHFHALPAVAQYCAEQQKK